MRRAALERSGPHATAPARNPDELARRLALPRLTFAPGVRPAERARFVTEASQALADLARALRVEPRHLGLGGTLSLSLAPLAPRRAACFDTVTRTIYLGPRSAAGCLAHEWWHALDQRLGRRVRGPRPPPDWRALTAPPPDGRPDRPLPAFIVIRHADRYRDAAVPDQIWLGVSVENADHTDRIEHLRQIRSHARFISFEPLLGPIGPVDLSGVAWAIVGGESGPKARPMAPSWATELRDRCRQFGVAFFFKQWGGPRPKSGGRLLEGREWNGFPWQVVPGEILAATALTRS